MTSAREQTTRLADLLRNERTALAEFLLELAEFDRQRSWIELGYTSLFGFLHRELRLSKGAAYYRMTAAQLIRRFPSVVEPLRNGRLCLMTVGELAKVLTEENVREVLPRFLDLSKREAREVVSALRPVPAPPLRTVVTAVRAVVAGGDGPAQALALSPASTGDGSESVTHVPWSDHSRSGCGSPVNLVHANSGVPGVALPPAAPRAPAQVTEVEPLTANLRRLHLTVSRRILEKLDAARAALSHTHPGASEDEIIEAGLDLLLDRAARRNGLVAKPRQQAPAKVAAAEPTPGPASAGTPSEAPVEPDPRYVPADVRRAVWTRDGGRCAWPLESGGVCGSTFQVQFDHVIAVAEGGRSTIDNVRLCCRFHNVLAARTALGDGCVDRHTSLAARAGVVGPPPP